MAWKLHSCKAFAVDPDGHDGYWVYAVDIVDVAYLLLGWQDCRFKGEFKVFPTQGVFRVKFPIEERGRKMRVKAAIQLAYFPIVLNHAMTGHKLQGKALDEFVIAEWSRLKNWAYVALSRVRTWEGFFLTKPMPEDIDFAPAPEYLAMMERLRNSILATPEQVLDLILTIDL